MSTRRRQSGFLSIVVLVLLVVMVFLAIALGHLLAGSTLASGSHVGAMQAFFVAESGLEFERRRWAQNLDWYRTAFDPDPAVPGPQAFGNGSFTVSTTLPATLLRRRLAVGAATIDAYTTQRFPSGGILQIGDDVTVGGEFVRYAGIAGNTFNGVARGQAVGSVATIARTHRRSTAVYPVTILRTALPAGCAALASIQVDAHGKFLGVGTLDIEGEEIGYGGASVSGGLMTLTGITRCLGGTAPGAHAIGQPVTPVLIGGGSASNEVEIASTGIVGVNVRYARRTIQR